MAASSLHSAPLESMLQAFDFIYLSEPNGAVAAVALTT